MGRILAYLFLAMLAQSAFADNWPDKLRRGDSLLHAEKYEQAAAAYTQAIAEIDTLRKPALFDAFGNRAKCFKGMGQYSNALADYNRAIDISNGYAPLAKSRIIARLNRSDILISTGQYEEMIDDLLAMRLETGSREAELRLNNLAIAFSQTNRHSEAIVMLDTLIANATDSVSLGTLYQNRAYVHWQCGERQQALGDFNRAVPLLRRQGGDVLMVCLSNRAVLLSEIGDCDRAVADIDLVLDWMGQHFGTSHPEYIIALRKKFEILLRAGKKDSAVRAAKAYYKAEKEFVVNEFPAYSQQRRLNFWKMKKPQLSEVFNLEQSVDADFLYDVALFRRSMSLLPTQTDDVAKAVSATAKAVKKKLSAGQCAVEFVCYRQQDEVGDTVYAAIISTPQCASSFVKLIDTHTLRSTIINGKPLREAVFSDDSADKDSLYTNKRLATMIWSPVMDAVPRNTKQVYFAPDGIFHTLAIEYLPYQALEGKELFRLTTTAKLMERKTKKSSASYIGGKALLIGGLDYGQLTGETASTTKANHEAADVLLAANPQGSWFSQLKYTGEEVNLIDTMLNGATVCRAIAEEDIKKQLGSHQLVHLATHGYALMDDCQPQNELLRDSLTEDRSLLASGIALSGANKAFGYPQREDGILSAKELSQLSLSDIRLIVLSACQTALGAISDEGPAGIVRGLKKGGANTVVATLWSVNDESTMLFMAQLYRGLAAGQTMHKAFANARAALQSYETQCEYVRRFSPAIMANKTVKLTSPVTEHPFASPSFWAAYILIDAI